MDVEFGEFLVRLLSLIFKDGPPRVFAVFVFIMILISGVMIFKAKKSEEAIFFIFFLAFALFVFGGQAVRAIRQDSVLDFQEPQETALEPASPLSLMTEQIQPQPMIVETLPEQEHPQLRAEDQLHKPISLQDILPLLPVGIGSSMIGYFLGYSLFSEKLIVWLSLGEDEAFFRAYIGNALFQIICGLPVPVLLGFVVSALAAPFFLKYPIISRFLLLFFVGLTTSFIAYFPYQFFILIAAAF